MNKKDKQNMFLVTAGKNNYKCQCEWKNPIKHCA